MSEFIYSQYVFAEGGLEADTFEDLGKIAVGELRKLGQGSGIVCGPLSTGGLGSAKKNFKVFSATIVALQSEGLKIFNQMSLENCMARLKYRWEQEGNYGYCWPILEEIYKPMFDSGLIVTGHFIPGFSTSMGATWERHYLRNVGATISYLPLDWVDGLRMKGYILEEDIV